MTAPSPKAEQRAKAVADIVVRDVCELPDRSSPEDEPGMLLVTTDELHMIVTAAIERDLLTPSGDAEGRARELLAAEYERHIGEGPYPTYAELARSGFGSFTLCSIRAIVAALTPPPAPTEAAGLREALELLRQTMNALACSDKGDPLEPIGGGMTVWGGMRAESARLWPKCTALFAALAKSPPAAVEEVCDACGGNGYSGGDMPANPDMRGEYDVACEVCCGRGRARPAPKPLGDVREGHFAENANCSTAAAPAVPDREGIIEECAKVAEARRKYFVVGPDVRQYVHFSATEAATAIRALKPGSQS